MGLNIGANPISDMYVGANACDRIYKGSDLLFDANSEIEGLSPIYFQSRANVALKNYRVYGVSGGAGEQTVNEFDPAMVTDNPNTSIGAIDNKWTATGSGTVYSYPIEANTDYCLYSDLNGTPITFYRVAITAANRPTTATGVNAPWLSHTNAITNVTFNSGSNTRILIQVPIGYDVTYLFKHLALVKTNAVPSTFIPFGYVIPISNEHSGETESYNLYIEEKLEEQEFVDYESGKVWKISGGTLTPIEPTISFPAITVSKGNNKISSGTTVGEIYVKGRINNQPLGYVMTQTTYDVLSPQQKYGNKYFAIYNNGTSGSVESIYHLTQTEYDTLTEYDNTGLYIIETNGTINNAYVGANQLDALHLGAVQMWFSPTP